MKVWERIKKLGGFWIHDACGVRYTVAMRYSEEKPERKARFISLEWIEEQYGSVIGVKELGDDELSESCLLIWTEKYILFIDDFYGSEEVVAIERNPEDAGAEIVAENRRVADIKVPENVSLPDKILKWLRIKNVVEVLGVKEVDNSVVVTVIAQYKDPENPKADVKLRKADIFFDKARFVPTLTWW